MSGTPPPPGLSQLPGSNQIIRAQLGGEVNGQISGADEDVYYVNMEIGTPPQPFRVKLDTSEHCELRSNLYAG